MEETKNSASHQATTQVLVTFPTIQLRLTVRFSYKFSENFQNLNGQLSGVLILKITLLTNVKRFSSFFEEVQQNIIADHFAPIGFTNQPPN